MKTIVLINGVARSGKDTFAEFLKTHLTKDLNPLIVPNAQGVKSVASQVYGWDGNKDERGRSLLIGITNIGYNYSPYFWEKYSESSIKKLEAITNTTFNTIIVPDFRYKNTYDYYVNRGFKVITIYVVRPDFDNELGVNKYDVSEMPMDIDFDFAIKNDSDFQALENHAKHVAEVINSMTREGK